MLPSSSERNRSVELLDEDFASDIGLGRECLGLLRAPGRMWNIIIPMVTQYTLNCCIMFQGSMWYNCVGQQRWPA